MKCLILTISCIVSLATCAVAQVAVIAHRSVPVDSISRSELFDLYTGETSIWSDGERVVIVAQKQKGSIKKAFYKFLGMAPSRVKSIWLKRMLSGESDPPEFVGTQEELFRKIASTPGAMGFIEKSKAGSQVKTLITIQVDEG